MKTTQIKVRGYHCDAYGHVNNARYLEFLEEGRWNFLQPAVDKSFFKERGLLFVVVNISISYKAAVVSNDLINVAVRDIAFNNMSIVLGQEITKGSILCNKAEITFVMLNEKTQKPVKIDADLQEQFNSLMNE